jgi:hypothetical protein
MEKYLWTRRHIDALRKRLCQISVRREMLEASAPPELRDHELRRRIAETKTEASVVLERLARLGVHPDETTAWPRTVGTCRKDDTAAGFDCSIVVVQKT